MPSLAQMQIIGNTGRDAELRTTANGGSVLETSVAVTDYRDKTKTTWFRVKLFGKRAESLAAAGLLTKGTLIYASGRFEPREYQDRAGETRVSYDLTADQLEILSRREQGTEQEVPF